MHASAGRPAFSPNAFSPNAPPRPAPRHLGGAENSGPTARPTQVSNADSSIIDTWTLHQDKHGKFPTPAE
jgi:hypothetical protein